VINVNPWVVGFARSAGWICDKHEQCYGCTFGLYGDRHVTLTHRQFKQNYLMSLQVRLPFVLNIS